MGGGVCFIYICECIYIYSYMYVHVCTYIYVCVEGVCVICMCIHLFVHVYIYIYIYLYVNVCVCVSGCTYVICLCYMYVYIHIFICIFWQHFFVNTNFIKPNRYFLSTYFLLDPFVFPYCFDRIRRELIYVLSIVGCIPSTSCPTLGHHQGRIYYKSDATFVFNLFLICKNKSCITFVIDPPLMMASKRKSTLLV